MAAGSLPVAVALVMRDDAVLLIRRIRGDYPGYWGLPGGKIEAGEHLDEAACREVWEETGLNCRFVGLLGTVSELFVSAGEVRHFLLHVCRLDTLDAQPPRSSGEGEPRWFTPGELDSLAARIIPSDHAMIMRMRLTGGYYRCRMEQTGAGLALRQFTRWGAAAPGCE
ncbi:NUDIX hydrolase [bacterium]|nr:NUDIX hydrolase [candidate division CSSED10-310 bacterium]